MTLFDDVISTSGAILNPTKPGAYTRRRTTATIFAAIALGSLLVAPLESASAAERIKVPSQSGPMGFVRYSPCYGSSSRICGQRLLARGVIQRDTPRKLSELLKGTVRPIICFDSPGGDLGAAVEMGQILRRAQATTCLKPDYKIQLNTNGDEQVLSARAQCASACSVAFLGGVVREIEEESLFGVHQFAASQKQDASEANAQIAMTGLARYFDRMGVRRELLDLASLTPATDMRFLTTSELAVLRITNDRVILSEWSLEPVGKELLLVGTAAIPSLGGPHLW